MTTVTVNQPVREVLTIREASGATIIKIKEPAAPSIISMKAQGPIGPQGPAGAGTGPQGEPGPKGDPGHPGQIRFTGNGAPPSVIVGAEPGDTYLDLISGDIYKLI
ncbi:hypothetical protein H0A71_06160 [Alcaligenaceae bacterium]|nr:hypothetical protein [Alcaligenaceae bacterium]